MNDFIRFCIFVLFGSRISRWRRTQKYMFYNPHKYARNLVEMNKHFELIVLCWESGQESPIHNHSVRSRADVADPLFVFVGSLPLLGHNSTKQHPSPDFLTACNSILVSIPGLISLDKIFPVFAPALSLIFLGFVGSKLLDGRARGTHERSLLSLRARC